MTMAATYDLRGDLIEACSCNAVCPCCVADDPDGETCDNLTGYYIRQGLASGVDVSNLAVVSVVHIPGNILAGNWREVLFVDEKASEAQSAALTDAFQGRLGGPLAEIAALVGDRIATYSVPITYTVTSGVGAIRVGRPGGDGNAIDVEMDPFHGPNGEPIGLLNSVVPGAVALAGKARHNRVNVPEHGMDWSFEARHSVNALGFHLTGAA